MNYQLLRKRISIVSLGITGILFIVAGILMFFWIDGIPSMIRLAFLIYSGLLTASALLSCFSNFKWVNFVQALLPVIFGLIFMFSPNTLSSMFAFLMGLYMLLIGLFRLIDFIVLNANKTPGRWSALITAGITLLFSLPLVFNPSIYVGRATALTAIFCLFYGLTYIGDFLVQISPSKKADPVKRKIRINMPVIFTSFIPKMAIQSINKLLEVSQDDVVIEESFVEDKKPDMEIFIHATETGFSSMGHVDIVFENKAYSYGNYDPKSWKFFQSVGDGVLLCVQGREEYVQFRLTDVGNSIFAYGIKLTDKQKDSVREALNQFKEHLYPWQCDAAAGGDGVDYVSRLYRKVKITSYKFKNTSFKAYFVMTTNCVKLADRILRAAGIAAATPNGILTPGAYLDFFERQYALKHSIVISRQSYTPKKEIMHVYEVN
ncbi:MAG: HdeD family acid-resistance protein [Anaerorhabdus sp.]